MIYRIVVEFQSSKLQTQIIGTIHVTDHWTLTSFETIFCVYDEILEIRNSPTGCLLKNYFTMSHYLPEILGVIKFQKG